MCAMSFYDSAVWVHVLFRITWQVQQHMQCVQVALWGQLAESVEDATRGIVNPDVTTQTMELPHREVIP